MIRVFRHDGLEILLNVDWIRQVESAPDTVITLIGGEKIKVKNSITDITTKIKAYQLGIGEENRDLDETPDNSERRRKFPRR